MAFNKLEEAGMPLRPTRIKVSIRAVYNYKGCEGEGTIVDISTGGLAMEVKQIFVPGDLLRIRFRLEGVSSTEIDTWGIVRSVNGTLLGIKFEEVSNENLEKIDKYVTSLLAQKGLPERESYEG
ncbi:PilZ domain-containing protein [Thermospira aquatica]|uniref:PilZ domain-containing protein n=1 Tax=Thermospira aquatica TaxID=2828656 RepID=A0AAX3BC63_9SPIR|nr:PilZ domain-containing protein [Thermospira aquatica]URA09820.1 PilZ domain-containing protein [Thermospira aquatica]